MKNSNSQKLKIVNPDYMYFAPEHIKELRKLGNLVRYEDDPKDRDEVIKRIKDADIMIGFWINMDKDMFNQLPNLKMVCAASAGFDWIDVRAAREKGIDVSNCPGHNTESVAEHTIGLMLAASRNTSASIDSLRKGEWKPTGFKGIDLKGKTLGIIGYGRIGKRVGEIAKNGIEMKVIYINSKSTRKEFEQLLKESDVLSINSPLTDQTRNLISDKEFKLMKDGVVVVNTGRGAVINETALLKYLKNGKVRAGGIDTYEFEPPKKLVLFTKLKNVIATPHISWDTEETDYYLSEMVVENIKAFLKGKPINVVN